MSGEHPKTTYSFNPTAVQFWIWTIIKAASIVVGLGIGIKWVCQYEFLHELEKFHKEAKPAIYEAIDNRIEAHAAVSEAPLIERMHVIESTTVRQEERTEGIQRQVDENRATLRRIETKVDRLLEHNGG